MSKSSRATLHPVRLGPPTRSYAERLRADERRAAALLARRAGQRLDGSQAIRPGPPPADPDSTHGRRLVVLLTPALESEVRAAAAVAHESVAEWLRNAALQRLAGAS
jgi:hypothetical protein